MVRQHGTQNLHLNLHCGVWSADTVHETLDRESNDKVIIQGLGAV